MTKNHITDNKPKEGLPPRAEFARRLIASGKISEAKQELSQLVTEVTGLHVTQLHINIDSYSLNSVNGQLELVNGQRFFFKYHQEDEEETIAEYYNSQLLADANLPVDIPRYANGTPGRQILLYDVREDLRLADVCRAIENGEPNAPEATRIIKAQAELDRTNYRVAMKTLHQANLENVEAEPIHQLFSKRLSSLESRDGFGGRVSQYYVNRNFRLSNLTLSWEEFRSVHWTINGIRYRHSIAELFSEAAYRLAPSSLAGHGAVTAHGDAHNANVWYLPSETSPLVTYDPAFAGRYIPALISEIKATFHNIFAHPFWLYEPVKASGSHHAAAKKTKSQLLVQHNWELSPLRQAFLSSKVKYYWKPLIAELQQRGWLPQEWQRIVRLALFCCPTLALNLRAGENENTRQKPVPSIIGFSIAMMAGSEPENGTDIFSEFIKAISP